MTAMDNSLLIDLGNTSLKWKHLLKNTPDSIGRLSHRQEILQQQLDGVWGGIQKPGAIWAVAVANQFLQDGLSLWVKRNWSIPVFFMGTEKKACGVVCGYSKPEDLGTDRWAAILAAYQYHPQGVCVVDCGTANTLDVVHADGRHLGGYILPGFDMMRRSLFRETAIAVVDDEPVLEEWGTGTASCIALGGCKAVASLVESSVERLQAAGVCNPAVILTGSSANEIASLIEIDHEIREHMVLDGLLTYARDKIE